MDSRQKIVDSAKRMFWHHGYSTTSPRQVMADSGVSQGSFYHHFPTKPELGREVVEANGRDVLDAVRAAMDGQPTGRDRLAAFLGSANEALDGCRVGGFAYDAGILAEAELRESLGSVFVELESVVEQAVRDGQLDGSLLPQLDPKQTAAALIAVVEGAFVTARATGRQSTADEATAGALALLSAPLGG
ncbi:TetR/AcrR family transcriptional regulator [Candidatus Mycobacterium wuenschmannii]|uniref:TetR/AcrR family transcriptional regulator n=1 Tax=Candidatus Mycobacterium wuenschmannii TaxID=3027808 RepID=A0ABY8W096_9MYCO|nr:TetR/AcrR family transcriptional regulator [Candidatus Mycobacterium wuenschmannii]WIM89314.1 TetR/AcrR family transcriptional regulator [Candidatus Mycobacterium wuenschmannii]